MKEGKGKKRISYKGEYLKVKEELESSEKKLESTQQELSSVREKIGYLEKDLASADKEAEEYLDYLKRLKAEFENYKKRSLKEREKMAKLAVEDLIKELLPVMDDLERALNSAKQSKDLSVLMEGVRMTLGQLKNVLKKQGLEEIKAEGEEFDPYIHEAVMQVELNKYPDNLVVEEMRKGYKLNDRILRPSMVKVNKRTGKARIDKDKRDN